ncbi:uncharacterized protein G2W53_005117 [Senna tora]|uniref:Uncharacterized protein n=1 Tax=Senna tora TaxID=362788 RepID=A0A835CHT6_9FABA|nr:uncharacterized protein G2W53_005117 [Senna tora]
MYSGANYRKPNCNKLRKILIYTLHPISNTARLHPYISSIKKSSSKVVNRGSEGVSSLKCHESVCVLCAVSIPRDREGFSKNHNVLEIERGRLGNGGELLNINVLKRTVSGNLFGPL